MPETTATSADLADLLAHSTIVDLSVTTGDRWPSAPPEGQPFAKILMNSYDWPRGPYLEYVMLHDDHNGTHVDAPCHFIPPPDSGLPYASELGLISVEALPLTQLMGVANVIDVRHLIAGATAGTKTRLAESPAITADVLLAWEAEHGQIGAREIVLFRTGWSDDYYLPGKEGFGYDRSHPAPDVSAFDLLHERGVQCVGIDARGIGLMQDDVAPHLASLGRNILPIENLTNLGVLPARGSFFIFMPHKFEGATGGMGRAIGIIA
jgi:kynurenine formamidase